MGTLLADKELLEHLDQPLLLADNEVKHFDREASMIVAGLQMMGWRGVMSARGHAIMRAPDGTTTCSVSRDSLRGRSGRNAAAVLKAWRREHPLPLEQEVAERANANKRRTSSGVFGKAADPFTERVIDHEGKPLPVATQAELRRHPMGMAWLLPAIHDPSIDLFITYDHEDGHRWVFGDVADGAYEVKAFGTGFATADEAHAFTLADSPARARQYQDYLYRDYLAHQGPLTQEDDMQTFQCPECDQTFDKRSMLGLHLTSGHGGGPCPECGKVLKSASGISVHRYHAHGYHAKGYAKKPKKPASEAVCEICGKEAIRGTAMASHLRAHERRGETAENFTRPVSPDVTPDTPRVRVRAAKVTEPVTEPVVQPGADVLADHLLNVPEGADAEDLIARVRAIVAAPLVEEVRRLRSERDELRAQVDLLVKEKEEAATRMAILREALEL